MEILLPAWEHPTAELVLDIQQALWESGLVRAAAAFDCVVAGYAVANDAVILNADKGFGYLERATAGLVRQEYLAP